MRDSIKKGTRVVTTEILNYGSKRLQLYAGAQATSITGYAAPNAESDDPDHITQIPNSHPSGRAPGSLLFMANRYRKGWQLS